MESHGCSQFCAGNDCKSKELERALRLAVVRLKIARSPVHTLGQPTRSKALGRSVLRLLHCVGNAASERRELWNRSTVRNRSMARLLTTVFLGLLLVSCNRPGSTSNPEPLADPVPAFQTPSNIEPKTTGETSNADPRI